ncbi:MAG: hypothetical protein O3A84_07955 [Proteobacteria bacterium]|nr:hypothetical protein [Pseudomonadota bacterium]
MSAIKTLRANTKQTMFVTQLVHEAETCGNVNQAALLLEMAREEMDMISAALRQHLATAVVKYSNEQGADQNRAVA